MQLPRGLFNLERMRSFPHDYYFSVCLPLRGESKPIWGGRVWQDSRRLLSPCHGCAIKIVRTKVTKKLFGNKWASEGRPDQGGGSVNAKPGSDPGCLILSLSHLIYVQKWASRLPCISVWSECNLCNAMFVNNNNVEDRNNEEIKTSILWRTKIMLWAETKVRWRF